jgi:hypothetical protein
MTPEKFAKDLLDNAEKDYGMCSPPLEAKKALKILQDHFLGEDWYVTMPISGEQVNSEAVYAILEQYPRRVEGFRNKVKAMVKAIKDAII